MKIFGVVDYVFGASILFITAVAIITVLNVVYVDLPHARAMDERRVIVLEKGCE